MSKMYNKIKKYYDDGLWNKARVKNMVIKEVITKDEYREIVGEAFNAT